MPASSSSRMRRCWAPRSTNCMLQTLHEGEPLRMVDGEIARHRGSGRHVAGYDGPHRHGRAGSDFGAVADAGVRTDIGIVAQLAPARDLATGNQGYAPSYLTVMCHMDQHVDHGSFADTGEAAECRPDQSAFRENSDAVFEQDSAGLTKDPPPGRRRL